MKRVKALLDLLNCKVLRWIKQKKRHFANIYLFQRKKQIFKNIMI